MSTRDTERDLRSDIDAFAAAFRDPAFRAELERHARSEWGWGTPEELHVEPLKAHRGRCTFHVAIRTDGGWHDMIGKVHATNRSDVSRTMHLLRSAGFGGESEFAIPEPLLYAPAARVLLEEKVEGRWVCDVFFEGSPEERRSAARRAAAWLAYFHDAAPRLPDAPRSPGALEHSRHRVENIVTFDAGLAERAERLLRRLEDSAPAASGPGLRAGHGSYIPEHVLLSDRRTTTIDFDECDTADPARDLAWFVVATQRLGLKRFGRLEALKSDVGQFIDAYATSGGSRALDQLAAYRAAECLHRAWRDLYKRIPPNPAWAGVMLDEGLRLLGA